MGVGITIATPPFNPIKYAKEWHVSINDGSDTTGDGSCEKPFQTISKAVGLATGTGNLIVIHEGTYPETVTLSNELTILGVGYVYCSGAWSATASNSFKISKIGFQDFDFGVAGFEFSQCAFGGNISVSSGAFLMLTDCKIQTPGGATIAGDANITIENSWIYGLTINSTGASVTINNCNMLDYSISLLAGSLNINESTITNTGTYGISTAIGTNLTAVNSRVIGNGVTNASVQVLGNYSFINVEYDATTSDFTGAVNLDNRTWFDNIGLLNQHNIATPTGSLVVDINGNVGIGSVGGGGIKYVKEFHVSVNDGDDVTGDGSEGKPFKTITHALGLMDNSGELLYIHAGTYPETVSVSLQNIDIVGINNRSGLVNLTGGWSFAHTGSSVRVSGLSFTSTLAHTGAGGLYLYECNASDSISKSGSGYFEANGSDCVGTGISVSGTGFAVFHTSKVLGLLVNNASATVTVKDSTQLTVVTVQAGTFQANNCLIFTATATGNAIASAVSTSVLIANSQVFNDSLGLGRVALAGNYSLQDVSYDAVNSTLGTSLGAINWFDDIGLKNVPVLTGTALTTAKILGMDTAGKVSVVADMSSLPPNFVSETLTVGTGASSGIITLTNIPKNSVNGIVNKSIYYIQTVGSYNVKREYPVTQVAGNEKKFLIGVTTAGELDGVAVEIQYVY